MNVWQSLTDIPGNEASVVTIGNFDGMHNGHKKVIATCVDRAHKLGVDAIAITFDPHPIQVHRPEVGLQLISPLRDRLDAMAAAGLDATLVARYDASVYSLEADEFVYEYLVERCGAREVVLTDTVPIPEEKRWDGLTVLSIAPLLASAIRAVFEDGSVAELFDTYPEHHGQGFLFA